MQKRGDATVLRTRALWRVVGWTSGRRVTSAAVICSSPTRWWVSAHYVLSGSKPEGRGFESQPRSGALPLLGPLGWRFRLRTGPRRALGADTPRDAELRGNLACSRLGSERKYVKRIHARDTGKARRQFAR